jgi:hypothetical protein
VLLIIRNGSLYVHRASYSRNRGRVHYLGAALGVIID